MPEDTVLHCYQWQTDAGVVGLIPEPQGRYKVMFDDENLGSYHSAEAAADDVSGGHIFSPSNGIDLGELGISPDLPEWNRKVFAELKRLRPI